MVTTYKTANAFLNVCCPLLEEKEAENNLILGLATSLCKDIHYYSDAHPLLLTVHHNDQCICACLQTPPKNLIIYAEDTHLEQSISELCAYLKANHIIPPGIIAPRDTVLKFNKAWTSFYEVEAKVKLDQMVYKLEKVNPVPISTGSLRQAVMDDADFIANWISDFQEEALGLKNLDDTHEQAVKKIREGALFLWETDRPVSMAGWTRPTPNSVSVALVYTPVEYRGHGYASSCVAQLSQLLLEQYQFCTLFTDLSNPTSNRIYQKIGYQPLGQVLECKFIYTSPDTLPGSNP